MSEASSNDIAGAPSHAAITARTTDEIVTFQHPFELPGEAAPFVAGDYLVQTDEEVIEGLSFLAWRRVATSIHVRRNGVTQAIPVDPAALAALLTRDAHGEPTWEAVEPPPP